METHPRSSMAASFGAGAVFSLVSTLGSPVPVRLARSAHSVHAHSSAQPVVALTPAGLLMDAARTGAVFSLLQGAFFQVGNMIRAPAAARSSPAVVRFCSPPELRQNALVRARARSDRCSSALTPAPATRRPRR
jgi:hypothetical protein